MIWAVKPASRMPEELEKIGLNSVTLRLLTARGFFSKEEVRNFLNPEYADLHDPQNLAGVAPAVKRIEKARKNNEKILIFGDYDADGVTSTVLLKEVLEEIGLRPATYIPDRNKEGYGLNKPALDKLKEKYDPQLLITVDCGVSNFEEIAYARKLGMDVIVTDHHSIPKKIPAECIIINPKLPGQKYPFRDLAGVGVVFKLAEAIWKKVIPKKVPQLKWFLDLVAIGTIADCVPLLDENRIFAKFGLVVLQKTRRLGINEIIKTARLNISEIHPPNAEQVAFQIGPRFNAAGRIDHADLTLNLLGEKNPVQARVAALELESQNTRRQKITQEVYNEARVGLDTGGNHKLIVRFAENWPLGIVGVVAGKIADEFNCPVFILRKGKDILEGSGRSIEQFDLIQAVGKFDSLLEKYGGHAQAMGIKIKPENLKKFESGMLALIESQYDLAPWGKNLPIDAQITAGEIDWDLFKEIQKFEPFGEGNREPIFAVNDFFIREIKIVGNGQKHLKIFLENRGAPAKIFEGIFFKGAGKIDGLREGDRASVAFNLRSNAWNGSEKLELNILDLANPDK